MAKTKINKMNLAQCVKLMARLKVQDPDGVSSYYRAVEAHAASKGHIIKAKYALSVSGRDRRNRSRRRSIGQSSVFSSAYGGRV